MDSEKLYEHWKYDGNVSSFTYHVINFLHFAQKPRVFEHASSIWYKMLYTKNSIDCHLAVECDSNNETILDVR